MRKHVLLIGLRAAGKSTLGASLAARLGVGFLDLDDLTARELGAASAGDALRTAGEPAFREAETSALRAACEGAPRVIALGGGTPTAPGAAPFIDSLRREGRAFVVYLNPPLAILEARLRESAGNRPSLTGRGVVEEMSEIARRRQPLYAALADFTLVDFSLADFSFAGEAGAEAGVEAGIDAGVEAVMRALGDSGL
jgi:shikimate kinase